MNKEFKIEKETKLSEIQAKVVQLRHLPTNAKIVHIQNDDDENVFCLGFRTLPTNSNGAPHILEHTVLCGSEKFPVKDPFFSMTRRSLNTYMNALTGPDYTCYPAASLNENDFYNLLNVYMDAAFKPNLKRLSFLQEGHRLEFEEMDNPNSNLTFKGIVFNEMKGALSSPISRLWQEIMQAIFPDIVYHHNFGGDPKVIPSLSYEELINFHREFYDVSRCTFFFYGNIPLKKHLEFLSLNLPQDITPLKKLPKNPNQPRFKTPNFIKSYYPAVASEDLDQKAYYSMSYLTCSLEEQSEVLALLVLDQILMGTDAGLLKKEILKIYSLPKCFFKY